MKTKKLNETEEFISGPLLAEQLGISYSYIRKLIYIKKFIKLKDVRLTHGLFIRKSIIGNLKKKLQESKIKVDK